MPYWIRDIEGRLVKIEPPRETELEVCLNIMDVPPKDQNYQHGDSCRIGVSADSCPAGAP